MKNSNIRSTRFGPLVEIDEKIRKDQEEQSLFTSGSSNRIRRAGIAPHSNIKVANFSTFINGKGSIEWGKIMENIDASELIHLDGLLTANQTELEAAGHPIDELLINVIILESKFKIVIYK